MRQARSRQESADREPKVPAGSPCLKPCLQATVTPVDTPTKTLDQTRRVKSRHVWLRDEDTENNSCVRESAGLTYQTQKVSILRVASAIASTSPFTSNGSDDTILMSLPNEPRNVSGRRTYLSPILACHSFV